MHARIPIHIAGHVLIVVVVRSCVASLGVAAVFLLQCPGFAPGPRARMALPSPFGGSRVFVSIGAFHALAATWHDKGARGTLRPSYQLAGEARAQALRVLVLHNLAASARPRHVAPRYTLRSRVG